MVEILLTLFLTLGITCFLFGFQTVLFFPLSFIFAIRKKKQSVLKDPFVSIIVPAYNEEKVIANCVDSILASDYPHFEIVLVDDGSQDNTLNIMRKYEDRPNVTVISKTNGGKATALNTGIETAQGEIVFCIDGDTFFKKDTIRQAINGFTSPEVAAVCGHDSPINLNNWQLKLINLQSHVGTGFVRRALSLINAMPIVTGNIGAFRKDVLKEIGGFRDKFIGEDLELTFRIHKAGYKVVFQPWAQVYAESPSTLKSFWKQRIRWGRGFIQTMKIHKDMIFNPKYGFFGMFLGFNAMSMVIIPVLQFISILLLPILIYHDRSPISLNLLGAIGYMGIIGTLIVTSFSIILDKSYKDFKYLPAVFLWVGYSLIMDLIIMRSLYLEIKGTEVLWNKFERTGIVSKKDTSLASAPVQSGIGNFRWKVPAFAAVAVIVLFIIGFGVSGKLPLDMLPRTTIAQAEPLMDFSRVPALPYQSTRAVAIHFEQYDNWQDAYRTVLNAPVNMNMVGVGAGRLDWNYFKWEGHRHWWSNNLKRSKVDFLKVTTEKLKSRGNKVVAIVDMFSPRYIKEHPEVAATDFLGEKSHEEICLTELAHGEFGRQILEMIEYIAKNYSVDAINITELSYENHCYDDRCKLSYMKFSGNDEWPQQWLRGGVHIDDESLVEWRCKEVESFVKKVAATVHAYGKELYLDVEVSWDNFADNAKQKGQDYEKMLQYADKLVIWNYFNLVDRTPQYSEKLAAYLKNNFDEDQIIISIGMWGKHGSILSANDMGVALASSIKGGIRNFWITPSHMLRSEHWHVLQHIYKVEL